MSEPLELLWREIEAAPAPSQPGWVRRLANPGADVPVHAAIAFPGGARSIVMDLPQAVLGRLQELPATSGLCVRLLPRLEGAPPELRSLAVELEDAQFADIFTIFCADVLGGISRCTKVVEAVILLLRRLERWQELLSSAADGLSHGELIGLFGELSLLRDVLVPAGGAGMVECWTGAQRMPQDFVMPGLCGIEVKTSAARTQTHVRIHGENQLDASDMTCLFLACLRVEPDSQDGESLNDVIDHLRSTVAGAPEFALPFARLLTDAGYMDRHRRRYDSQRFRLVQRRFFKVDDRFPRLLAASLPSGVDEVEYRLDLKACSAFECDQSALTAMLNSLHLGGAVS